MSIAITVTDSLAFIPVASPLCRNNLPERQRIIALPGEGERLKVSDNALDPERGIYSAGMCIGKRAFGVLGIVT